ncbi:polysaccharide lyase family 8 super-sandwich domain-containing protein [Flavobacterium commune]|uniref:PKD/Chitinase domain-containing protein n=2 Tax=Flavobacterium commune TaxID=1306519 RepID=A0A1D9PDZ8_9FLAO|nr:polysaccharide lyase family 8 super-sandwich domain-containing protein [Flavobacterium commune]APA00801.1 hypothetical protein BIW12_15970 [Flavobacterium commune]
MKIKITHLIICLILISSVMQGQITIDITHFNWSKIENTTPVTVVNTDADNGDGFNDGAMLLKSAANTPALQGVQYQLAGSPVVGEQINLELNYYQIGSSFLKFKMQVYNVTDNVVLAESAVITTTTGGIGTTPLSYAFTSSSVGDQIIIRFVRADDLNSVRQAGIDYLKVNGQFISMQAPQINFDVSDFSWSKIEDTTPVSTVKTDADNGDGLNDGAVLIKGTSNTPALQGIQYLLTGSPFANGQITIETKYWQTAVSYCKFKLQIYNVTDNVVLAETAAVTTSSGSVGTLTLNHIFTASSDGDQIRIQFVRADDLNPVRQAGLDYVKVNGQFINMLPVCKPVFNFDLPLTAATTSEIDDLAAIRASLSNQILGTSAPTMAQLNTAISDYNALNITASGNVITGNPITSAAQIGFLKIFARYLKFNPSDTNISDKAVKTVWYISSLFCNNGTSAYSAVDFYDYPTFTRPAIFLNNFLPDNVKDLFGNTLSIETDSFKYLFDSSYDFSTTQSNGAILTDIMYLDIDVLFAYADWFKTNDEKIRYLKTVKRFLDRFLIYTYGQEDGLKKDGLSYHHGVGYDGYMYAFNTISVALKSLEGTNFQIDQPTYQRFRDAVYAQAMYSNDTGVKPFALAGRNPQIKTTSLSSQTLSNVAITGGKILGLGGADPVLVGIYNRKYGVNSQFNNNTITPFEEGYIQFNSGNLGVYRKNNWIASMKGQSDVLWGSEVYAGQNRFGRYQSYGALEIIYPGNSTTGNGYSDIGWDWNYNPGTTTIVLPWNKLHAERERVDEYNTYGFAGSLALNQINNDVLSNTVGQSGLFAMKFKERNNLGFGISYGTITHNATFEFTKTYFAIDNYIICLANGIKNNDDVNSTVTTLFQRLNNNSADILVNGAVKTNQSAESFGETSANWIIDNYNTGYYILPNSGTLKIRNSNQITPYQNQVNPSDETIASNSGNNYHLAYLDHGNAPANDSYEFVCVPATNSSQMTNFAQQMQSAEDKPYKVYQNNTNQQIIEHITSKTWAYALPAANTDITNGFVNANDTPCLVMYRSLNQNYSQIVLSVSNPDLGASPSSPKVITLTLNNKWNLLETNPNANIVSATETATTIAFTTSDGLPVEIKLALENPCALLNGTPEAPILDITQPTYTEAGSIQVSSTIVNLSFSLDEITFDNTTGLFENLSPGNYTVYAKNADGCISSGTNAVIDPQPVAPLVTIDSSLSNKSFYAPAKIILTADASDADGTITKVEFFNEANKLGEVVTGPYSFEWDNVLAGNYSITAKATDNDNAVSTSEIVNVNVACPPVQLLIPDVYAMDPSVDLKNTLYIGYGPSSLTLTALVLDNQAEAYSWNTGAKTATIEVSEAGTYTVTITYAGGGHASASITINTLDVSCGNNTDKVQICHNGKIICVAKSAVQSHLDHGDHLGTCSGNGLDGSTPVVVYPNPVQDFLNVSVTELAVNAKISLYNFYGNKMREIAFTTIPQNLYVGDLVVGTYFVVIQNGNQIAQYTIIKK